MHSILGVAPGGWRPLNGHCRGDGDPGRSSGCRLAPEGSWGSRAGWVTLKTDHNGAVLPTSTSTLSDSWRAIEAQGPVLELAPEKHEPPGCLLHAGPAGRSVCPVVSPLCMWVEWLWYQHRCGSKDGLGKGDLGVPGCLPPESLSFAPLTHLFPKLSLKACPGLKQSKDVPGEGPQGVRGARPPRSPPLTPRTLVPSQAGGRTGV